MCECSTRIAQNVWCSECLHLLCIAICMRAHAKHYNITYFTPHSVRTEQILLRYWPWFQAQLASYISAGKSLSCSFSSARIQSVHITCKLICSRFSSPFKDLGQNDLSVILNFGFFLLLLACLFSFVRLSTAGIKANKSKKDLNSNSNW